VLAHSFCPSADWAAPVDVKRCPRYFLRTTRVIVGRADSTRECPFRHDLPPEGARGSSPRGRRRGNAGRRGKAARATGPPLGGWRAITCALPAGHLLELE
jgi:hypothetical protein